MSQWINLNSFANRMRLPLLCEKSGAILLYSASGSPNTVVSRSQGILQAVMPCAKKRHSLAMRDYKY